MIRVNAAGCSLVDNLYGRSSFAHPAFRRILSRRIGDGGLVIGGLTFSEALAEFAGEDYPGLLNTLTRGSPPDSSSIGGPGIVPMIHAAQVCRRSDIRYRFAGVAGRDAKGRLLRDMMDRAGFPMDDYTESPGPTPGTDVFSDPDFDGGRGERTFVNTIGAADGYGPESLPGDFFDADIILFGATALVPPLHDDLSDLCRRARHAGAFVIVCTVFDFRNEARMNGKPWPLVDNFADIDLLVMDREESLKISGAESPGSAMRWFLEAGCAGVVITQGADDILLGAAPEGRFRPPGRTRMPTCRYADEAAAGITGNRDTTGCGDNFVGGLIDSIAHQTAEGSESPDGAAPGGHPRKLNLEDAVIFGVAAGSMALTCLGGVYYENAPGEKRRGMQKFLEAYRGELARGRGE